MKITAYHGSKFKIESFSNDPGITRLAPGNLDGIYFATNKRDAQEYGKYIYTVSLTYNKMFTGDPFTYLEKELNVKPVSFGSPKEEIQNHSKLINKHTVTEFLLNNNYDIVHKVPEDHYIAVDELMVFNVDQIEILNVELNDNSDYYEESVSGKFNTFLESLGSDPIMENIKKGYELIFRKL